MNAQKSRNLGAESALFRDFPYFIQDSLCQVAQENQPPAPSIEERLCAAAHRLLTDGRQHAPEALAWAVTFLARSAPGRDLTTFIRSALRQAPIARGKVLLQLEAV